MRVFSPFCYSLFTCIVCSIIIHFLYTSNKKRLKKEYGAWQPNALCHLFLIVLLMEWVYNKGDIRN